MFGTAVAVRVQVSVAPVFVPVAECEVSQAKGWNEDNDVVHSDDAAPQLHLFFLNHFFRHQEAKA